MSERNEENKGFLLQLSRTPIQFEPVTKVINVFYDEVTGQVFTVRSGGATGVNVKGHGMKVALNFRLEDKGPLLSIKFSPNQQILAVQRSLKSVEFQNFINQQEPDGVEYSQLVRGTQANILGFIWVSNIDFILISNQGIEHYQIVMEKRLVKSVKNYSLQSNWFVYSPASCLLLVSSGPLGNSLQPFLFKPQHQQLLRLTKFDVDIPDPPKPPRLCLEERDVMPTILYGQTMVLVLKHFSRPTSTNSGTSPGKSEIIVYTLSKDSPARKTHVLLLETSGKLAVSILDNLIIVHHQASKTSSIYDIRMNGESDGRISTVKPFLPSVAIRPYFLPVPAPVPAAVLSSGAHERVEMMSCDLYSPNWVFFQPNVIIDALLGCLWTLELVLPPVVAYIMSEQPWSTACDLFEFLLQRNGSKPALMSALSRLMSPSRETCCDISVLGRVLDKLNESYRDQLDIEMQSQIAMPASASPLGMTQLALHTATGRRPVVVVDQSHIYSEILVPLVEQNSSNNRSRTDQELDRFVVAVVNEYIRSLVQHHIPVQHFIYEVLIEALARLGQFYQLHQLFQYHAVADSKPLACLLLSLESVYPASYQLALDMLKRISSANEEIIEVLLSKNKVIPALRFAREMLPVEAISARKFLEAAQNSNDTTVFYGVYKYFQQRNQRARGSTAFLKGEHCDVYTRYFRYLFESNESNNGLTDSLQFLSST